MNSGIQLPVGKRGEQKQRRIEVRTVDCGPHLD